MAPKKTQGAHEGLALGPGIAREPNVSTELAREGGTEGSLRRRRESVEGRKPVPVPA